MTTTKAFGKANGSAIKNTADSFKIEDGDNVLRMVGGLLPRYVYWVPGFNGKNIPVECLSFDRETERFLNAEKDHVPDFFKDIKCSWAYAVNCIDPKDGKVKVFNLKKKLYQQMETAMEDLGDPTDPKTGWNVVFKKVKTGSSNFNVEYTLVVLKCKVAPLTEKEIAAVAEAKTIDQAIPRNTPDEILALLKKINSGKDEENDKDDDSVKEAINDLE